eukprot:scaffold3069_cov215-Amphora_coffeaeformis.AAC.23
MPRDGGPGLFRRRSSNNNNKSTRPPPSTRFFSRMASSNQQQPWTAESVASLPPPGLAGPSQIVFSPATTKGATKKRYLAFISSPATCASAYQPSATPPRRPAAVYPPLTGNSAGTTTMSNHLHNHLHGGASGSSSTAAGGSIERQLMYMDLTNLDKTIEVPMPLLNVSRSDKRRLVEGSGSNVDSESGSDRLSLEERLRRERQRLTASSRSLTQFSWNWCHEGDPSRMELCRENDTNSGHDDPYLRILVPVRGSLYLQEGVPSSARRGRGDSLRCVHDKTHHKGAVDPQLSPDGTMVAWTAQGEIYAQACHGPEVSRPIQLTFGAVQTVASFISHGIADFVAQEEMDRYRGFWWHPQSKGIILARVDESQVPPYRIVHPAAQPAAVETAFEDHRYPFAGHENPKVQLAYVPIERSGVIHPFRQNEECREEAEGAMDTSSQNDDDDEEAKDPPGQRTAREIWGSACIWFSPPREASEYLARVHWIPDGSAAVAQWQNRAQNVLVLQRLDMLTGKARTLLVERSKSWINLHHLFRVLPAPIHPDDCGHHQPCPPIPKHMPEGSFSFLFGSERTGFLHLYLYTYCPGINGEQAVLLRAISSGDWMVEGILGVDIERDLVYMTGTYDSHLERHLYAMPLTCRFVTEKSETSTEVEEPNGVRRGLSKVMNALSGKTGGRKPEDGQHGNPSFSYHPYRLTELSGMHSVVMDDDCQVVVDTSSDLDRPTSVRIFRIVHSDHNEYRSTRLKQIYMLFDALQEETPNGGKKIGGSATRKLFATLPAPELITFPTSDGSETLNAAIYKPDPRLYGNGPYPLICAVYGGPHVQRVNRSWSQCADMRAQRFRSLGFCVVKCDNRGSSRRGLAFESAISRRLGRLEVLDQVAAVRQLTVRGIADSSRVGIYGWSYGGYLSAMCLCRAPDVFSCAVAGAPVTSWDAYDTHYTERYMGLPADNPAGYRESAVFDHIPNMRGKLMIVHGLIDENVHFRHTARLINRLVSSGREYELLLFPEERHSPRRLRDRIYMEQRIGDFFVKHLSENQSALDLISALGPSGLRNLAGHL